jgi:hypothetical protein
MRKGNLQAHGMHTQCSNIKMVPATNVLSAYRPTQPPLVGKRPVCSSMGNAATPCVQQPEWGSTGKKTNACGRAMRKSNLQVNGMCATIRSNIKMVPETNVLSANHPTQPHVVPDRRPLRLRTVQTFDNTCNAAMPCLQPPVCGSAGIKNRLHSEGPCGRATCK